ncbi:uncharacterized protein LOC144657599 [Oculina patagonica]
MSRFLVWSVLSVWILAATKTFSQFSDTEMIDDGTGVTDGPGPGPDPTEPPGGGDDGCVAGDMEVKERWKGVVHVSELSVGDVISGITGAERKPAWCKVVAVFPAVDGKNKITYDGFTADHMVIDHTVHPYGKKGEERIGPIYTLATDCDASVNAAGQAFSPISTAFCPHELSWSEYIILMSAIRGLTNRTGYFWFDTSAYHDNETAMVPHWFDQLHQICHHLLLCAREGLCQGFENVMKEFVHEHLNKKYAEVVEREFPNMGGDVNKEQAGTLTGVVRPQESSHVAVFSVVGSAMVVLLIAAVAVLLYRGRMMKKAEKKLPFQSDPHPPAVAADDVKA